MPKKNGPRRPAVPQKLTRRVRLWQNRLGLQNWQIRIVFEPLSGRNEATVDTSRDYQNAKLTVNSDKWDDLTADDEALDFVIVHELWHILTVHIADLMEDTFNKRSAIFKQFTKYDESSTDAIAAIIIRAFKQQKKEE